jgi:23S rRNA pseudouridine1911/1915/1917 synthase
VPYPLLNSKRSSIENWDSSRICPPPRFRLSIIKTVSWSSTNHLDWRVNPHGMAYVGLHHRLDTPASGLLLLCTDRRWNKQISTAFQNQSIKREYWIACLGSPPASGIWNTPLQGKKAVTHFHTVQQYHGFSCLSISLQTGRKHQIRIHAQQAGHPILGDRRYGGSTARLSPRLALHAQKLTFIHPATQESCTIESPLPETLHSLLSR